MDPIKDGEAPSVIDGQMRILAEHLIYATDKGKVKWTKHGEEFQTRFKDIAVGVQGTDFSISVGIQRKYDSTDKCNVVVDKNRDSNGFLLMHELFTAAKSVNNQLLSDAIKAVRKLNSGRNGHDKRKHQ